MLGQRCAPDSKAPQMTLAATRYLARLRADIRARNQGKTGRSAELYEWR